MLNGIANRYSVAARFFHWGMALGFAWMLLTAIARNIDKEAAFTKAIFAYHSQVGFTLLLLAVLRIILAIRRGHRAELSAVAKLGHKAMYALMVIIPTLAFLRIVGAGRAFDYLFVIPVLASTENKTEWLVDLGNNFHGLLGWVLFALILGHAIIGIQTYKSSAGMPTHNS